MRIAIVNELEAENFLIQNPDLHKALNDIIERIPKHLLNSSKIEYYKDIEEQWEKLFLLIETGVEDVEEFRKIEEDLYNIIMKPLDNSVSQIILSVS